MAGQVVFAVIAEIAVPAVEQHDCVVEPGAARKLVERRKDTWAGCPLVVQQRDLGGWVAAETRVAQHLGNRPRIGSGDWHIQARCMLVSTYADQQGMAASEGHHVPPGKNENINAPSLRFIFYAFTCLGALFG